MIAPSGKHRPDMTASGGPKPRRIGLALGGGAILGAVHIGILKAFDEKDLKIDCISGTSIGAFIAGLYAFGVSPSAIGKRVEEMGWLDISGFTIPKYGLLSNEKLGEMMKADLGDVAIENAAVPLALVATDIGRGEKVVAMRGSLAEYVMASTCIPGIFSPVLIEGRPLVDGGLLENVPVSPLKSMGAEITVGVDLNANRRYKDPDDIIDVLVNAIDITIDNATRLQVDGADIVICPDLNAYNRNDADAVKELIEVGYDTGVEAALQLTQR